MSSAITVRALDAEASEDEVSQIAARMRETLIEVLGEARGAALYDMAWLEARVRFHLDPRRTAGVLLAERGGEALGHTIVRAEPEGGEVGLFSTTYVHPAARRSGVGRRLLAAGEAWMQARELRRASTWTAADNQPLLRLYAARGYAIVERDEAQSMVRLSRELGR